MGYCDINREGRREAQTITSNNTNPHHLGFPIVLNDVVIDGFLNV